MYRDNRQLKSQLLYCFYVYKQQVPKKENEQYILWLEFYENLMYNIVKNFFFQREAVSFPRCLRVRFTHIVFEEIVYVYSLIIYCLFSAYPYRNVTYRFDTIKSLITEPQMAFYRHN